MRCRQTRESVLQKLAQFWVFLTQTVESGPGLIWRTPEVRTGLCQGANPGGQRGLCRSIHAYTLLSASMGPQSQHTASSTADCDAPEVYRAAVGLSNYSR